MQPVIIGAGLSGLIAAHRFPRARVIERAPEPNDAHRAVLRFRSDAISTLTGIPFRRVTVRKGIWADGGFVSPSIALANAYSAKCHAGAIYPERSIWNVEPAERFIAPEDFYFQMLAAVRSRVEFGTELDEYDWRDNNLAKISTIPLHTVPGCILPAEKFRFSPIKVTRYHINDCDVHQTIYFPKYSSTHSVYRASITGNLLICEQIAKGDQNKPELNCDRIDREQLLFRAFGLQPKNWEQIEGADQRYGKIAPIDDAERRAAIHDLSTRQAVYSFGRFATWRNVLLDDLLDDAQRIANLMQGDSYTRALSGAPIPF